MNRKRMGLSLLGLVLCVLCAPALVGFIQERGAASFFSDFYVQQQANLKGGWKVGTTGYDMDSSGNLDALTVDAGTVTPTTLIYVPAIVTYNTTTTARTITAAECKADVTFIVTSSSDDPVTFNLPAAVAGMTVTFIDDDATAAADLTINPDDADKIDGGTAGVSYNCTSDAVGQSITLRAVDGINWVPIAVRGTWAAGA